MHSPGRRVYIIQGKEGFSFVVFVLINGAMKNRPSCCAPLKFNGAKGRIENLVSGFKGPFCEAIARSTGEKCKDIAVTGSKHCRHHGGKIALVKSLHKIHPKLVYVRKPSIYRRKYESALKALPGKSHENFVE
jgi:hypothetical protein